MSLTTANPSFAPQSFISDLISIANGLYKNNTNTIASIDNPAGRIIDVHVLVFYRDT